jgi:hypothetical protein
MNATVAALGGLAGGAAMIAVLYPAVWMFPRQMKMDFLLLVGTMLAPAGAAAYGAGLAAHAMMSVVFGLAYGGVLDAVGVSSVAAGVAYGALFGLVHALIAGALLGMMPMVHPRLRPGLREDAPAFPGAAPVPEELIDPPGFWAMNYPLMTAMGFFMLHALFGSIVGALYGGLA